MCAAGITVTVHSPDDRAASYKVLAHAGIVVERIRLTAKRIREFSCAESRGREFLRDSEVPQLAVRATRGAIAGSNAHKAFVFVSSLDGRSIRQSIGSVSTWGIDQARGEARRRQMLIDRGADPRQEKAQLQAARRTAQAAAERSGITVGEAWKAYIKARTPRWSARYLANHEALAKPGGAPRTRGRRKGEPETTQAGPLHELLQSRLAEVDAATVEHWLNRQIARGPTQAAQAFRVLRAFIGWCAEQADYSGIVSRDAFASKAIRETVPRDGVKTDCLQREQLAAWFKHVQEIRNPVIAAYLQILLLTGARREELAGLTWGGVDFRWNSLTMHDKMEGRRVIPLTPYVASLLSELPRRNVWVFSSPSAKSGRLQEPRIQHVRALAAAGIPPVSLHGLRRSFGTLGEWVDAPVGVVAQIMGHKPSALAEKHYRRRPLDLLRMWHTRIETWILAEAGVQQPVPDLHAGTRAE